MSTFHSVRMGLKTTLVSALLIFDHLLSASIIEMPQIVNSQSSRPMPKPGSRSLSTLSAPTFLTLLWIMFSLLEAADRNVTLSLRPARQAPNGAVDRTDGDRVALGKTWVELGCGWVILGCWAAQRDQQAGLILDIYSANLAIKIALLPLSYIILIFCLTLLNLHLTSSIALYGCRNGLRAITTSQFWNGRSGWWLDRIVLEDDYVDAGGEVFGAEEKV